MYFSKKVADLPQYHGYNVARMSVVWSLTGTTVTDTTLYMFHTVNGCIMRVYWFYSLLSFSVVHSSSFFLAFITDVVCVMDLVVWNKRGLDWIAFILILVIIQLCVVATSKAFMQHVYSYLKAERKDMKPVQSFQAVHPQLQACTAKSTNIQPLVLEWQ